MEADGELLRLHDVLPVLEMLIKEVQLDVRPLYPFEVVAIFISVHVGEDVRDLLDSIQIVAVVHFIINERGSSCRRLGRLTCES